MSPNSVKHDPQSRASMRRQLIARLQSGMGNVDISDSEAKLLEEAIICLEEKDAIEARRAPRSGRKPKFLPTVIVLSGAWIFAMPTLLIWPTSIIAAVIASVLGLLAGIAAVKLDPGMKGYWIHDVD